VPVNDKPITILELTGLPAEIINVVVSVLCRMTLDFAMWSEGQVPVTLVCEEAHRYVPANANLGFEPCKRAIAKIAKEGRKYGASLCIVTQRPTEIDPTILSQCNTVFALRMSNDRDQQIVQSAVSDTGSGLLEFLPALGQREAIAFGDGVALPVRIKFDELPKTALPRSSTARFSEKWQKSVGDEGFLEQIVDRWRATHVGAGSDLNLAMLTDALDIPGGSGADEGAETLAGHETAAFDERSSPQPNPGHAAGAASQQNKPPAAQRRQDSALRRDAGYSTTPRAPAAAQRETVAAAAAQSTGDASNALRSLRDKLMQRSTSTR
jgi:hypothetical protein